VKRAEDLDDPEAITVAIAATQLETIVGRVDWSNGPVKNVSKTPLVGGQWQLDGEVLDLKIVANSQQPNIPITGELKTL
jgi:branched-chain amino acid transport system substrate-binding protein